MLDRALRKKEVKAAFGITADSSFYDLIPHIIPPGEKIDPHGRVVIWWESKIKAIQESIKSRAAENAEKELRVAEGAGKQVIERQARRRAQTDEAAA
jgi:predicted DNA-binding transcriptional regulator AlpA